MEEGSRDENNEGIEKKEGIRKKGEEERGRRHSKVSLWAGRCHNYEQIYGGEMSEKEKWNCVCTLKRAETGDMRVVRNRLM